MDRIESKQAGVIESDAPIRGGRRASVQIDTSHSAHTFQDPCSPHPWGGGRHWKNSFAKFSVSTKQSSYVLCAGSLSPKDFATKSNPEHIERKWVSSLSPPQLALSPIGHLSVSPSVPDEGYQ